MMELGIQYASFAIRTAAPPVREAFLLGPFELTHQCGLVDLMHLTNPHWNGVSTARAE
jgi:hypothetical protein